MSDSDKRFMVEFAIKESHSKCTDNWTLTKENFNKIKRVFTDYHINLDNYCLQGKEIKSIATTGYQGHLVDACGDLFEIDEHTDYAINEGHIVEIDAKIAEYYEDIDMAFKRAIQLGAVGNNWEAVVNNSVPYKNPYCYNYLGTA